MKVTVEFNNGATVTYRGNEAQDIVNYLSLDAEDYQAGETVDIGLDARPSKEADDAETS